MLQAINSVLRSVGVLTHRDMVDFIEDLFENDYNYHTFKNAHTDWGSTTVQGLTPTAIKSLMQWDKHRIISLSKIQQILDNMRRERRLYIVGNVKDDKFEPIYRAWKI